MKIFLNPGHCKDIVNGVMADPGACNTFYNLQEAVIADKIAKELRFYLECADFDVVYLQSNNLRNNPYDDDLSQPCIVTEANLSNADFAISIHLNAFNHFVSGTETIVYSRGTQAENIAGYIQASITEAMGTVDRGLKYEEDKPEGKRLSFIMKTNMPAILIECCFIDSERDAKLLLDDEGINCFAKAIFDGIINYITYEV